MRSLGGALSAHLATATHTRAMMLRLDMKDGSTLAITDHDRPLPFDLGDGQVTYTPRTGILASDLSLSTGMDADEIEITGALVAEATESWHITKAMVIGGRFDEATARYFQVNWRSLGSGAIKLLKGYVVKAQVDGGRFKLTVHSEISKFQQEIGRTITAYCDADFGDARCGFTPETLEATVVDTASLRQLTVSFSGTFADDYFNKGTVQFDTGALAGTRPIEVFAFQGGNNGGTVALWTEMAELPDVGDTLTLRQGCGKTRDDCMGFDNIVNFRGFPDVPGSDQVLRYPNPAA